MGVLSKLNRARKKATKAITKPFVKTISKISDKFIPNELRFLAPYAAGIGTLMLPPGMGPLARAFAGAGFNTLGQIAANETPVEDISDLNALSIALAGGLGALGSDKVSGAMRGGIEAPATTAREAGIMAQSGVTPAGSVGEIGFLQGAENVGREGIASLSDYVTGSRDTLAGLGRNPGKLFSTAGATEAAKALGPTLSQATGDVAYEAAIDAQDEFDRIQAEEMAQAGMDEAAIANARRAAIREAMEVSGFTEEDIMETFDEIGLKQGGIVSLAEGGMLDFGGREMDLRSGGFVPIGKKEKADDVPARLSKNEFVMTADAVRAAGGGSVNKGAQRMYNLMNNLEARA